MNIAEGTLLEIRVPSGELAGAYVAYLRGAHRMGYRVTIPMILDQYRPLPSGTEIKCSYTSRNTRWHFTSQVLGYESGALPDMIIAPPTEVFPEDRRRLYRLPVALPVVYWVEQPFWGEHTQTVDLSVGGVCFDTSRVLERGWPIMLQIKFGDSWMALRGEVAWSRYVGTTPQTGIRYQRLSRSEEETLSRRLIELELRIRESK